MGGWACPTPLPSLLSWMTWFQLYRRLGGHQGQSGRAENLVPTRIQSPDRPARAQSLYKLSYPAHLLSSKRCKLRLLQSQTCLLNTTFWQINFPSSNYSISSHLLLFALLLFARALLCQEGARLVLFQISVICVDLLLFVLFCCYLCWSVVICFVLLWFVLICCYLCWSVVICVVLLLFVLFCIYLCCSLIICFVLWFFVFCIHLCFSVVIYIFL